MLNITNLEISIENTPILRGITMQVRPGEIHAIMGPNGSGKSSLANFLAGKENHTITAGSILFDQKDLNCLTVEQRAHAGLFLAFQYPVEIPGVSTIHLLKAAFNALRTARGEPELDAMDFLNLVRKKISLLAMDQDFLYRSVNEGFSGGEKKRNEILQMAILEPRLAILDEIDSGLDIDSLKIVAQALNALRNRERSMILITHYQRLLNYVQPDYVHVLVQGKILRSGDFSLAQELEQRGYGWITDAH